MFTSDNFNTDGIEYDYDALNQLLSDLTDVESPTYADDVKNASDRINDSMIERNGEILVVVNGRACRVGRVIP